MIKRRRIFYPSPVHSGEIIPVEITLLFPVLQKYSVIPMEEDGELGRMGSLHALCSLLATCVVF